MAEVTEDNLMEGLYKDMGRIKGNQHRMEKQWG